MMLGWTRWYAIGCCLGAVTLGGCHSAATPEQLGNEPIRAPADVTLYDRLGGGSAIYAITDRFLDTALRDSRVNFRRVGHAHTWQADSDSVARLKLYWAQYFDMLADGPQLYEGRNLLEAHRGMDISEGEWLALMEDLKQTLEQFQVPPADQNELLTRVGATHGAIVNQ
jgi:hemoglobin